MSTQSLQLLPAGWSLLNKYLIYFAQNPCFLQFFLVLAKHLIYFFSPKILVICIFVLVLPKYCVLFPIITFLHNFLCFAQISLLCVWRYFIMFLSQNYLFCLFVFCPHITYVMLKYYLPKLSIGISNDSYNLSLPLSQLEALSSHLRFNLIVQGFRISYL